VVITSPLHIWESVGAADNWLLLGDDGIFS
jgi:hypothetical protein